MSTIPCAILSWTCWRTILSKGFHLPKSWKESPTLSDGKSNLPIPPGPLNFYFIFNPPLDKSIECRKRTERITERCRWRKRLQKIWVFPWAVQSVARNKNFHGLVSCNILTQVPYNGLELALRRWERII
jgi:hypothetical protein